MLKQIVNVNAVLPDGIKNNAVILIDGENIIGITEKPKCGIDTIDGEGGYLLSGFIDIHCHGGNGYDFMDAKPKDALEIARYHLSHGTTTLMPTTTTDYYKNILLALDALKEVYVKHDPLTLYGVHLEGPYLSPEQCGAQSADKMELPSIEKLKKLLGEYPFIKRVSVAPELCGGLETGRYGKERGLIMSVAHTAADFDGIMLAARNGYSLMTHLYSGMYGVVRKNAYRVAGAVEAGLYADNLFVEIIADGKHLPTGLLKLIYKCKGAAKICLITDAMRASGLKDGETSVLGRIDGGVKVIVEDGVAKMPDRQNFAGSVATFDKLVRTMVSAGVDLVDVSRMASATPATVLGLNDRGSIEIGKRADLVITDDDFNVKKVIFKGAIV